MRMYRLLSIFAGIVLATISLQAFPAHPQSIARIVGTVTDPSGATISGAAIHAQTADISKKITSVQSGPDGKFSIDMPPGRSDRAGRFIRTH